MPKLPPHIKDKKASNVRSWLFGLGALSGLFSFSAFSNGDASGGFWTAVICAALIWIGTKIKTKRNFRGGLYD